MGLLFLLLLIAACKPTEQQAPVQQPPVEAPAPTTAPAPCFDYTRNGVVEQHCAVCGNNVCEPFETCTASSCTPEGCTRDCGQLYCEKDCAQEDLPILKPGTLPEITASIRTCNTAADCMRVKADCCGCTMGGQAATFTKKYVPDWEKTLDVKCEGVACIAVMSNHWSCFADIKCIKNKCTLVRSEMGSG